MLGVQGRGQGALNLRLHGAHDELRVLVFPVDDLADVSQLVLYAQKLALKSIDLQFCYR